MKSPENMRKFIFPTLLLLFLPLYLAIITRGSFEFREVPVFLNYNMLTEALLSGRIDLKIAPHPGRVQAPNPTDPRLPYPFIVDAIIWNGRHYFTQDPAPALIHLAFFLLTGRHCPTGLMVVLFACGTLAALWFILRVFQQAYAPEDEWALWVTWLSFAVSGAQLFMVSRAVVYHEAIAAGMCFVMWGTYLFLTWAVGTRSVSRLGAASLLWGLGFASRITLIMYPMIFIPIGLLIAVRYKDAAPKAAMAVVMLIAPAALCVSALLLYNYHRFGDFLDFGRTHITVPAYHFYVYLTQLGNSFRPAHVIYNLYHYFAALPQFDSHWPYMIHPFFDVGYSYDVIMSREAISSFLFTMPILLLLIPTRSSFRMFKVSPAARLALFGCAAASLAAFALLLFYYRAVSRYLYEFTPLLFPIILCNLVAWRWRVTDSGSRRRFAALLGLLCFFNALAGVWLALSGMRQ